MNSMLRRRYFLYVASSPGHRGSSKVIERHDERHGGAVIGDEILEQEHVHVRAKVLE
jgi:hypothetical protein